MSGFFIGWQINPEKLAGAFSFFRCNYLGAIKQFNISHRRIIPQAETHFQDTQITTIAISKAWAKLVKYLADDITVACTIER